MKIESDEYVARLLENGTDMVTMLKEYLDFLKSDYVGRNGKDLSGGRIAHLERLIRKVQVADCHCDDGTCGAHSDGAV